MIFHTFEKDCCISFVFHIKPQLIEIAISQKEVVYLLFSTSNHNSHHVMQSAVVVVYLLFSTSNHNSRSRINRS